MKNSKQQRINKQLVILKRMRQRLIEYIINDDNVFKKAVWMCSDNSSSFQVARLFLRIYWLDSYWDFVKDFAGNEINKNIKYYIDNEDYTLCKKTYTTLIETFVDLNEPDLNPEFSLLYRNNFNKIQKTLECMCFSSAGTGLFPNKLR